MGIFDTPAIVNSTIKSLKSKSNADFEIDVVFTDEGIFTVKHDYFKSPCYFSVSGWSPNPTDNNHVFAIDFFPHSENILKVRRLNSVANSLESFIVQWQASVKKMLQFESMYIDTQLEDLKKQLALKLGLTDENMDELIDDIQKKHAKQFCDQIRDILDEMDMKEYDQEKIQEIKFDLEKIKRDIESLKIKTKGELTSGIAKAWGKIQIAKIGSYIVDKLGDATAAALLGQLIQEITTK